ncbi:ImmA/IrrE family metallo-endopeptidase [Metabacillus litoralis]|uniref:ImmA/IrrE family metallo-endopeptidase n=1 Tax=Metabacillus litoralis TaxID=152268 RepID=UPI0020424ECE|nr:ImmA/IrrE family metallo-endopeptidase [Metabacillus litoralis]MCM3411497.1 ImmA/IrrE family metallo-endopeptidase [Metabacillus litoralis]
MQSTAIKNTPLKHLTKPRFAQINELTKEILNSLGNPTPYIPLWDYAKQNNWHIEYSDCQGPLGYMVKVPVGDNFVYCIRIATDVQKFLGCDLNTAERMQYWTLAHEIGHIILHGHFTLNTKDISHLDPKIQNIMEVEAHWFASRLLIPDYIFKSCEDLDPQLLADKCKVNLEPAIKRINSLRNSVYFKLKRTKKDSKIIGFPNNNEDLIISKYDEISYNEYILKSEGDELLVDFLYPEVDSNMRVKECYKCGNSHFSDHATNCKKCGVNLYNECTNDRCEEKNVGDADYCESCGNITTIGKYVQEKNPFEMNNGEFAF